MILERLVTTNLLTLVFNPRHSIEGTFFSALITIIAFLLFLFWYKKGALLNFQAWALLMALINAIFYFHYAPWGPHVLVYFPGDTHGFSNPHIGEYQFTPLAMLFLRFLEFITSTVTIWNLWKLSEKYIPKDILMPRRKKEEITINHKRKRKIIARFLAVWHTAKNGGNNVKNDKKIKKNIKLAVLNN